MVGIKRGNGRLRSRPLWARGAVSFTCDQENDRAFGIPIGDLRWLRELKCQCSPILIWTLALPSMSHQKLQLEISRVGDLERAHLICFPKLGAIRVKQRSCFYHLPDSLPMKHAFQGLRGTWFIHAEAHPWSDSNESGLSECVVAEIRDRTSNSIKVTDSLEPKIPVSSANKNHVNCKRKKNGIKRIPYAKVALQAILANAHRSKKRKRVTENCSLHCTVKGLEKGCLSRNGGDTAEERELSAILENHSETLSESLSVSGIIKKYFSDYEEVSLRSNFTSRANQSQLKRTGVGNRLVVASNNLGRSVKSATGLCRFGDRKLSVPKSSSFVRSIVFEISDSDE
ncbi:unnamed protein product [Camellia sinensis]